MLSKIETLHTIFDLLKRSGNPCSIMFPVSDLLVRTTRPYEEVSKNLTELQKDGFIIMKQLSVMLISITEKGMNSMMECICNSCISHRTLYLNSTA